MDRFDGKPAVITGDGTGMGRERAREAPEDAYEESFIEKLRAETNWALGF